MLEGRLRSDWGRTYSAAAWAVAAAGRTPPTLAAFAPAGLFPVQPPPPPKSAEQQKRESDKAWRQLAKKYGDPRLIAARAAKKAEAKGG